jgi:hypothetical protein
VTSASTTTGTERPSVSEAQLRGLIERFKQEPHGARLLVVAADPVWDGPEVLETDRGPVRVVCGGSVLGVRVALVDHPDETLVVLTRVPMHELGVEVAARAWRGRVEQPSPWNAVLTLFRATEIDPQLRAQRWMIELLVSRAPIRGYPQPVGGVLTLENAWETLYRTLLGIPTVEPTTVDLIRWVSSERATATLVLLSPEARRELDARLARQAGPAAPVLTALAERGADADAVALGLVVDALWPAPDRVAKALLEAQYLDSHELTDAAAEAWARAAVEIATATADRDESELRLLLHRAEELLASVKGTPFAASDLLPSGLARWVGGLGQALTEALDAASATAAGTVSGARGSGADGRVEAALTRAEAALDGVRQHRQATRDRVELGHAAVRLLRRPRLDGDAPGDLTEQTWRYLDDGAWVDAARERLAAGDTDPTLAEVSRRLGEWIDSERRARDRRFAKVVAQQATSRPPSPSLAHQRPLRIEQVLDAVVAPIARQTPVLLLVLDGLSHAAAVPLLEDLDALGWRTHGPDGRRVSPALATLPSVTNVSRSSLLTGRLQAGGQDVERDGFASHPGLVDACAGGPGPELFHKKALRTDDGHVAPRVRAALEDGGRRVVGVVFNGVDDFLGDLDQLRVTEGIEGLPPLRELLDAALQGDRAIVLTSDHGHVLGTSRYVPGSGGERYRLIDERPPQDGEVEVSGDRVLAGEGHIIAAADGEIRYYAAAKRGHHGGATPAEMLCPLHVLLPASKSLEGWRATPVSSPAWWDPVASAAVAGVGEGGAGAGVGAGVGGVGVGVGEPAVRSPAPELAAPPDSPQPGLFDEPAPPSVAGEDWVADLLASPRLAAQRKLAGRTAADDKTLATVLRIMVAAGGTAPGRVLEVALDTSPMRLRGTLNGVRSLLDVEGYPVLRVEADGTAHLDVRRLAEQFQIELPGASGGRS